MNQEQKRRVKQRVKASSIERLTEQANNLQKQCTNVVGAFGCMGMYKPTLPEVLECVGRVDAFVRICVREATKDIPENLREMMQEHTTSKARAQYKSAGIGSANTSMSRFLAVSDNGAFEVDYGAIEEECTVYISDPRQLRAYDAHVRAAEALQNFIGGVVVNDRINLNELFTLEGGVVVPDVERTNYEYLAQ